MTQTYYSQPPKLTMPNLLPADYSSLANWAPGDSKMNIDTSAFAMPSIAAGAAPEASSLWGSFQNWMNDSGILGKTLPDGTKLQGWGGLGLGAASGIMNSYLGFQQLKLAKDAAAQNKDQFNKNFAAQASSINTQLEDRQRARVASNPTAYQSVGDYMKNNRIGG